MILKKKKVKTQFKLTKKDIISMVEFNRSRSIKGEPKLNEQEYINYIYGRTKLIETKRKLKSFDIPVWASDPRGYSSATSDHIATKKNDEYKKEISKQYPVSLICNKGNYQVLLSTEIQTAGRKV